MFGQPLTSGGGSSANAVDSRELKRPSGGEPSGAGSSASSSGDVSATVDTVEAAPAPAGPDAIDENPEAVWYVRPPSGGQFGPAKGDVMRKWLAEGRVSPDALVWREGWADWKEAEPMFPSLARRSTPPPPPAEAPPAVVASPAASAATPAPQAAAASPTVSSGRAVAADSYASGTATSGTAASGTATASTRPAETSRPAARKKSNIPALIAIGVLAVVCIGLLVGLLVVSGVFS
jgi:hypothetical protein